MKRFKNRVKNSIRISWLRLVLRVPFLPGLHYLLFSRAFDRELRGVIAGHLAFERNSANAEKSNYSLRRNIHRIEKGLIMRPRRENFAAGYIQEVVESYIAGHDCLNESELNWAYEVLCEYFSVAGGHKSIDKARARFEQLPGITRGYHANTGAHKPHLRDLSNAPPVTLDALKALSVRRRSVRWFSQEPVPRDYIDRAIEVASLAPSACNRQPFQYRIFDQPDLVQQVVALPMGIKGYGENIPAVAVLVGRLRAYPHPRDRHVIYIDASLSAMAFMYALETMGLASCPINWPDIPEREKAMKSLLGLADDERPVMLVAIGYPDPQGLVPGSSKVPVSDLRTYNSIAK